VFSVCAKSHFLYLLVSGDGTRKEAGVERMFDFSSCFGLCC
jgi:hypothetical protein